MGRVKQGHDVLVNFRRYLAFLYDAVHGRRPLMDMRRDSEPRRRARAHSRALQASERAYSLARQRFELGGRRVLDATVGGKLQVFEKVSYASLF